MGVLGPVTLKGLNSGMWDLSTWEWSYKVRCPPLCTLTIKEVYSCELDNDMKFDHRLV